jgi:sphingolipid 8-(E)-desaturase
MRGYRIGVIDEPWIDCEPPISGGTFNSCDQEETIHSPPGKMAVKCDVSSLPTSRWPNGDDITFQGSKRCLGAESSGFRDSLPCSAAVLTTNKRQWLESQSIVSDALKQSTSQFNPAGFIDHAVQLQVDFDLSEYPSLNPETQRNISINFRKLHQKVREKGLHICDVSNYSSEVVRYVALFSLFILTLRTEWYITSAVFLGLFWHQIMFVAHDAGHLAITHNFKLDTIIGIFIADFCCGLSIGWWKSSHNVHHLVPNHPVRLQPSAIFPP